MWMLRHISAVQWKSRRDLTPAGKAQAFGEAHGIPAYDFRREMLEHVEPESTSVPRPTPTRTAFPPRARAGKHIIVEKPLTGFFGPATTRASVEISTPRSACSKA